MQEKAKEPEIRFAGFTGAWEQRKFSKLVLIERGGSPRPIDNYITNKSNGINWVKIGDAPKEGRYITKTAEKIRPEGVNKSREVFPGDLILSNSMSFGKPYIMGIRGCIHDGWLLIRDTNKIFDPIFLCYLLGTDQMLAQYKALASGSTVNNLNKELVGNTHISLPGKEEQHVIGEFLQGLDSLLTLHQRKYEKLLNIKKSMLEKMFPKEGEVVPEIRFKGFTGAWEQRELGEISEIKTGPFGSSLHASDYVADGVPIITTEHFKFGSIEKNKYLVPMVSDTDHSRLIAYSLKTGDIVFSRVGSVDINALVEPESDGWLFSGRVLRVRSSEKYDSGFLHNLLETDDVRNDIRNRAVGQTMPSINTQILSATELTIPSSKREQQRIGNFFKGINQLLTLHQRKLEMLKNVKQAFLEKMFV